MRAHGNDPIWSPWRATLARVRALPWWEFAGPRLPTDFRTAADNRARRTPLRGRGRPACPGRGWVRGTLACSELLGRRAPYPSVSKTRGASFLNNRLTSRPGCLSRFLGSLGRTRARFALLLT